MTTAIEKTYENKGSYVRMASTQMDKWREGIGKLDDELKKYPPEVQAAYRREIGTLRSEWWQAVNSAYANMDQADEAHWENARHEWGRAAAKFWQNFLSITQRIQDDQHVPLGWVQGLTEERMHQSAGWAEGLADRPQGSEGWAEGMGTQKSDSAGWAEGYEEVNK